MSAATDYARRVLTAVVGADTVSGLADDTAFFDQKLVDSLQIVEIIGYLEDDLGLEVAGEDLTPENFGSINGIAAYLVAKGAVAA